MNRIRAYLNNFFWLFSTYLAAPYLYSRIFLKKKNEKKRILVIQLAKIGDLVCTTPVFREIKRTYPGTRLTLLVSAGTRDVIKNNSRVDEIISINDYRGIRGGFKLIKKIRKENYDWILNLSSMNTFANALGFWAQIPNRIISTHKGAGEIAVLLAVFNNHRFEFKAHTSLARHHLDLLKILGVEGVSEEREIFITKEEEEKALNFLRNYNLKQEDLLVGLSCTSMLPFRQWDFEKFAKLADLFIEKTGAKVVFVGSAGDASKNEKTQKLMRNFSVNAAGKFSLSELPAFLKKLKLFISMDTGPIYIANAVGVPVVNIVGPDDMKEQCPIGKNVRFVQKKLDCAPCSLVFSGVRYCKEGHLRCVKEITPREVFEAGSSFLKT